MCALCVGLAAMVWQMFLLKKVSAAALLVEKVSLAELCRTPYYHSSTQLCWTPLLSLIHSTVQDPPIITRPPNCAGAPVITHPLNCAGAPIITHDLNCGNQYWDAFQYNRVECAVVQRSLVY